MKLLNDVLGWDTDSTDEEFGTALNDDINKLVELSLGVVMAKQKVHTYMSAKVQLLLHVIEPQTYLVFRALPPT